MVDHAAPKSVDQKVAAPQLRGVLAALLRGVHRLQDDDVRRLPRDGCEERCLDLNHDLPANRAFGVRVATSRLSHVALGRPHLI